MALFMTRYATKILDFINASCDHPTAERIFLELKPTEPKLSFASVYNNLNTLTETGMIRRISMVGQADRYDKIVKHDHLVCKACGKLADFSFDDLTAELKNQLDSDIFEYDLKVFYLCPECRNNRDA